MQNLDGGGLIDHLPLLLRAAPGGAQTTRCRNRAHPLVDQPHAHRRDRLRQRGRPRQDVLRGERALAGQREWEADVDRAGLVLRDDRGETVYTGWLRRVAGDGRVVYTGFYATEKPPGHPSRCIKVVFPLPRGNATVVLKPVLEGGRFRLISAGERFGDPGFYRVLQIGEDRFKVRYLRTLREYFTVYSDETGVLRCDHEVRFFGITMLRLHYKMIPRAATPRAA